MENYKESVRIYYEKGRVYLNVQPGKERLARTVAGFKWHANIRKFSFPVQYKARIMYCFPETVAFFRQEYRLCAEAGLISPPSQPSSSQAAAPAPALQPTLFEAAMATKQDKWHGYQFKLPPFPHQREMLERLLERREYALFCEMGTGKTKPVIDLLGVLKAKGEAPRALVICPNTLQDNWGEETEKNSDLSWAIVPSAKGKRIKVLTGDQDITIMNYEKVILEDGKTLRGFDFVVLDESHKIKSHKAKRTKKLMALFSRQKIRKYCLTGTPVGQCFTDIYTQLAFLNPAFLGFSSFYSFRNFYGVIEEGYAPGGRTFKKVSGIKPDKKADLNEKIAQVSVQLKKEDCHALPAKLYEKQIVDMSPPMKDQYKRMERDLLLELQSGEAVTAAAAVVKILRLQEILGGHYLQDQKDNAKLKVLQEIVKEQTDYGNSVIIWAHYIKSIKTIEAMVQDMGLSYSIIWGAVKDRQKEIKAFQSAEKKVFIGQIATGGVGITLTAASLAIYFENEYSLINRKQSEDRCHRIGQRRQVTYIDLLYRGTVEFAIMQRLRETQATAQGLVDSFVAGRY